MSKPITVSAYGKTFNFPADTSVDEIESTLNDNEHLLNPEWKAPDGFTGIAKNVLTGAKQTGRMIGATVDTARNNLSGVEDYARESSVSAEQNMPIEQRKLLGELKEIDRDQGAVGQIGDTLKAAGRNPMGTAQMVVEQLPNTAVSLGGGYAGFKTGAAAGSLFGPVGAAIGGTIGFVSGMFLGNVLLEAGGKAIEKASDEDGFTPQDRDTSLREGAVKAAVITGVDAATFKIGGMLANKMGGSAIQAGAKAETKVLMDAGVDVTSLAAINAALKSSPELYRTAKVAGEKAVLQSLSTGKKAAIIGSGVALETASEGVGEYAGEYAATGKGDVVDATIEALSSATMSVAETAYNYNKVAIGNDLSPEGIKKVADNINERDVNEGVSNINKASSVDEAIKAANDVVSRKPTTSDDVLSSIDPTLKDIERLTGLKPSDAVAQVINGAQQAQDSTQLQSQAKSILSGANVSIQVPQPNEVINEEEITKQKTGTAKSSGILGKESEIVLPDGGTGISSPSGRQSNVLKSAVNSGLSNIENSGNLNLSNSAISKPNNLIGIDSFGGIDPVSSKPASNGGSVEPGFPGNILGANTAIPQVNNSAGREGVRNSFSGYESESIENLPYKTVSDIQFVSNLNGAKAFKEEGFNSLDRDAQNVVMSVMKRSVHNSEVFNSIVRLIPVDVMNDLARNKLSPEMLFHNPSMLLDPNFGGDSNSSVPLNIRAANAAINAITRVATENPSAFISSNLDGGSIKFDTTSGTIDDRHDITPNSSVVTGAIGASTPNVPPIISNSKPGKATKIVLPDGRALSSRWEVVDADLISASIKESVNQPRDRARAASNIQIQGIANNPDYFRLSDSPVLDVGSPTLSYEGAIVGGNGRFEAISRSYEIGTSKDYLNSLIRDAANKGIDLASIAGMKKPVLVRRITQPFDTRKLAIASNSGTSLQYSGLELAKIDADRMAGIEALDITDSGDIALTGANIERLKMSLGDYSPAELSSLVGKNGELSQDGVKRVRNAMLAKAYGNSETLGRIVESTDGDMRNVLGALTKSAGVVAKARSEISAGAVPKEVDITDNLLDAVETFSQIRAKNQPLENYLAQQNMFGDGIDSDSQEILQFLHDNVRSQKKLTEFIKQVYDQITRIDQTTDNIFGDNSVPSKSEIIKNAKQRTEGQSTEQQQGIFAAKSSEEAGGSDGQESKTQADNAGSGEESQQDSGLNTETSKTVFDSFSALGNETGSAVQAMYDAEQITGLKLGIPIEYAKLGELIPARFDIARKIIEVNTNWFFTKAEGAQFIAEEILHYVDSVSNEKTISASSKLLDWDNGEIINELREHFESKGAYSTFLKYPIDNQEFRSLSIDRKKAEVFARMGVLYFGELDKLSHVLPKTYRAYHGIFKVTRDPVVEEISRKVWSFNPSPYRKVGGEYKSMGASLSSDGSFSGEGNSAELGRLREVIGLSFRAKPSGEKANLSDKSSLETKEAKFSRTAEERLKDRERARQLEKKLNGEGYEFSIEAKDVRMGATQNGRGQEAATAERIAKIFGRRVVWIEASGDFRINGVVVPSIKDTIFIDYRTDKYAHAVIGHELSHHMEHDVPAVYRDMVRALLPMINDIDAYRAKNALGEDMSDANVVREIVGDIMGDNFTDPVFWNKVAESNPSAFKRIADAVISWLKRLATNAKMRGLGSEQWVTDAQKAQDIVAKAVAQYTNQNTSQSNSDQIKFNRSQGWYEFPNAIIAHRSVSDHKDYQAAKDGDFIAAVRLAKDTIPDTYLGDIKQSIGDSNPIVVPVRSAEKSGAANAIPEAVGLQISSKLGIDFDENGIQQMERVGRTGADGWHRIANQPTFEGDVEKGRDYVIVDDTLAQGGTVAQLKEYIESNGGKVSLITALTGKQYSAKIGLSVSTLQLLRDKHGSIESWFKKSFGYGFEGLTESEARFIISARGLSSEQVRTRIIEAKRDGTDSDVQGNAKSEVKFSRSSQGSLFGNNNNLSSQEELLKQNSARPGDLFASANTYPVQHDAVAAKQKEEQTQESLIPEPTISKQNAPGKIEDFGQKLGNARKDMEAALRKEYTDADIASVPLSKIWPKEEALSLEDPFMAAFAFAAREEIPTKPKLSYKVKSWVEKVKLFRGLTRLNVSGAITKDKILDFSKNYPGLENFFNKVQLLELIENRKDWSRIDSVAIYPDAYKYDASGIKVSLPYSSFKIDGRTTISNVTDIKELAESVNGALSKDAPEKLMQFEIRGRVGNYFINKKGDKEYRPLAKFTDLKEARAYWKDNYDDLVAAWEMVKDTDNVKKSDIRGDENRPRTGKNWRGERSRTRVLHALIEGADVDAKLVSDLLVRHSSVSHQDSGINIPRPFGSSDWPSLPNGMNPKLRERSSYMTVVSINLLRNLSKTESFGVELLGKNNIPLITAVQEAMLTLGHNDKVIRSIVERIPVNVMDFLASKKISAESLFRDKSVLKSFFSIESRVPVGAAIRDNPIVSLIESVALDRTEIISANDPARISLESDTALMTGQFDSGIAKSLFSHDVSPDEFYHEFSFRGVEFGNWVSQGAGNRDRQGMLNQAYDALMDLSSIMGVPPKAMSLEGSLGLGFGSRGKGAALAHFEPGNLVINLTKTKGAGNLAHEFFHALDNYFQRKRDTDKAGFITYSPERMFVHKEGKWPNKYTKTALQKRFLQTGNKNFNPEMWIPDPKHPLGVRPEIEAKFSDLVQVLNESPMKQRAEIIDKGKADGYWSRIIERAARSFENYVIAKMMKSGYNNDYLANVTNVIDFRRDPGRYPYLLESEIAPVEEAFDNLFSEIKTKETDKGIAMFSRASIPDTINIHGDDGPKFSFAGKNAQKSILNEDNGIGNADIKTTEGVSPERTNSLDIPRESRFRKFQRKYQDSFNRFTVVKEWLADKGINVSQQADVYAAEERYHAKVANQVEDFREQIRNPLIEKIAKAGFTMDDIADYLEAQHAPEANEAIRKLRDDPEATAYGIADDEAKEYLSKAPGELGKLANELRSITEQTKKLRLDGGLLNKDITDAWEATYKHYIPVKGAEQGNSGTGKGMSVKVKNKRRLGHGRRDEAVIENILQDHERAIMEVEKNRVGKHVVMMAAEIGIPELMTIGQPAKRQMLRNTTAYEVQVKGRTKAVFDTKEGANLFRQSLPLTDKKIALSDVVINPTADQRVVMSASPMLADNEINVYIDGHAIRVQINDELMARAYKKLGIEGYGEIVSAGRMLNSYLSKVYTGYNPEFIMTNMVRDFTTGVINLTGEQGLKMAAKAISNYPKSFATLLRYAATNGKQSTDWIDAYRRNGGNTGAAYLSDMERLGNEVASEYAAYQGVIANLKQGDMANAARAAGRKAYNATLKWIYNLNQAGENAMRLSAFKAMIDSGMNVNDAAKAAKNITVNFNRKGELGVEANAAYLFFNASVQGTAATLHALVKGKNKYQAWALASGLTTLGYLAAASLGGGGEDDYDKIDDYTKERNAVIKYGDGYLKLPIPYGYGFFWNIGRSMADAQRKDELHTMPWHIAASAIEELTPFGSIVVGSDGEFKSDQVLGGALPTVAQIPYQISNNKQLFSGGELMPDSPFDQSQPDREKMWRGTKGTMYDQVSGWLAGAGMDVSPETLKFMTRTATGGAGALVDSSVSAAMLKADGAELDSAEMPFIRKAYKEISIKDTRSAFYKAREEAKLAAEEFNRARRKNDLVAMQTVINDKKEMLALDAYADKLSEVIRYARDQQDAVRLNKDIPIAEKRLRLKELEMNESKFYDKYLDVFNINKIEMKKRVNQ